MEDCIFCKISEGKIPADKFYENNNFFSIPDRNPVSQGHSLVISKKHFETFLDVPPELGSDLLDCLKKTVEILMRKDKFPGFNIINNNFEVAGQVVKHFHTHIIPRRKDDGLNIIA